MLVKISIRPANTVVAYFVALLNDDFTSSGDDGTATHTHTHKCLY
jgi:hypothetical protein